MPSVQAFTPFVRVVTDAARHFATFGLAPAAGKAAETDGSGHADFAGKTHMASMG